MLLHMLSRVSGFGLLVTTIVRFYTKVFVRWLLIWLLSSRLYEYLQQSLCRSGRLDEAEQMYLRALEGYEKSLHPEHISIIDTLSNKCQAYDDQRRSDKAKEIHSRVQVLTLMYDSPERDPSNNPSLLHQEQDKIEEMDTVYQQALEGTEKTRRIQHTLTFEAVSNVSTSDLSFKCCLSLHIWFISPPLYCTPRQFVTSRGAIKPASL